MAPGSERVLAPPIAIALPATTVARARPTPTADDVRGRRRWLGVALRALVPPALLFVVLVVPPQSLRATLVTLLIIAALGLLVWRLPMADEE